MRYPGGPHLIGASQVHRTVGHPQPQGAAAGPVIPRCGRPGRDGVPLAARARDNAGRHGPGPSDQGSVISSVCSYPDTRVPQGWSSEGTCIARRAVRFQRGAIEERPPGITVPSPAVITRVDWPFTVHLGRPSPRRGLHEHVQLGAVVHGTSGAKSATRIGAPMPGWVRQRGGVGPKSKGKLWTAVGNRRKRRRASQRRSPPQGTRARPHGPLSHISTEVPQYGLRH